jgi:uncharacterized damage-inducible protein DinB
MLSRSTGIFNKTVAGISDEKWLEQPGSDSNHMLWIAGHVVVSRASAAKLLGASWSAPWEKLFSRGSKRVDANDYPPGSEIQSAWQDVSEKLNVGLANATTETLSQPTPQGMPNLDGTVAGTISFLCLHEIYHVGQMGYLRKWLGYGQVIG